MTKVAATASGSPFVLLGPDTWVDISPPGITAAYKVRFHPTDETKLYLEAITESDYKLYISSDSGATWTAHAWPTVVPATPSVGINFNYPSIWTVDSNGNVYLCVNTEDGDFSDVSTQGIWKSTNNGVSWSKIADQPDFPDNIEVGQTNPGDYDGGYTSLVISGNSLWAEVGWKYQSDCANDEAAEIRVIELTLSGAVQSDILIWRASCTDFVNDVLGRTIAAFGDNVYVAKEEDTGETTIKVFTGNVEGDTGTGGGFLISHLFALDATHVLLSENSNQAIHYSSDNGATYFDPSFGGFTTGEGVCPLVGNAEEQWGITDDSLGLLLHSTDFGATWETVDSGIGDRPTSVDMFLNIQPPPSESTPCSGPDIKQLVNNCTGQVSFGGRPTVVCK